ncbi:MAG: cytidine deaminase [Cyclobacteriaceae bacterium]
MKEFNISSSIFAYDSIEELPDALERDLCKASIKARESAYAAYSKFSVGSALLLDNHELLSGSNQENAVYPLGLCAERVAIFSANTQYPESKILKLAVSTSAQEADHDYPAFPCGSCRQVLSEQEVRFANDIKVLVVAANQRVFVMNSIKDILPFTFTKDLL